MRSDCSASAGVASGRRVAPVREMSSLIHSGERVSLFHYHLDADLWRTMLAAPGATLPLVSAWADSSRIYILLLEGNRPLMASCALEDGRYLGPSSRFPAAEWGERVAYDLYGVEGMGARDDSPAVDEGGWDATWPLSERPGPGLPGLKPLADRPFLRPERTGLCGPLGLSFDICDGRAEGISVSAGFAHRGVLSQLIGKSPEEGLRLVSRVTAGGFVAHPLAFVRAVEQARGELPGPGIRDTRFLLLEIERISVHLHDIAVTMRSVEAEMFASHCDHAREAVAQACARAGVSRRLTDLVTFTGLKDGLEPVPLAQAVCDVMEPRMLALAEMQRTFGARLRKIGALSVEAVREYAVGGVTGRASGRSLDLRRREAGMRLDALRATGDSAGDAQARNALRLAEIRDSLALMRRILASIGMDDDEPAPQSLEEGIGAAEGPRGDVWYWVQLKDGLIKAIQVRDPSASLLPVLGKALDGLTPDQLVTALRSFGLAPSGIAL